MKNIFLLTMVFSLYSTNIFCQSSPDTSYRDTVERVFEKVEVEAEFPGGEEAWREYLQKNLDSDVPYLKGANKGMYKVVVQFIVSKDGTISDVIAETNFGHGMEKEVIRVIKNGPKWIPATQDGRKVNAYRRQPVTFLVLN